jgi:hypothetical protein
MDVVTTISACGTAIAKTGVNQQEAVMNAMINLGSEVLVDRSKILNPYLRLLLTVVGEELAEGSPWIAVDKQLVSRCGLGLLMSPQVAFVAA